MKIVIVVITLFWVAVSALSAQERPPQPITSETCIQCHSRPDSASRSGKSTFVDQARFSHSAHGSKGVNCTACHEGIVEIDRDKRTPHKKPAAPACKKCHESEWKQYSNSVHAKLSAKACHSCHDPHYGTTWRYMGADRRQQICLKCHDARSGHKWLAQRDLHFRFLECASCHALDAKLGMVIFFVDRSDLWKPRPLDYNELAAFVGSGKDSLIKALDPNGDGVVSAPEMRSFVEKMRKGGLRSASLRFRILVVKPSHIFTARAEKTRNCALCHSKNAEFYSNLSLRVPQPDGSFITIPVANDIMGEPPDKSLMADFYMLGETKTAGEGLPSLFPIVKGIGFRLIDSLGFLGLIICLTAVCAHWILVFLTNRFSSFPDSGSVASRRPTQKVWHWIHGLLLTFLGVTGLQLRFPDLFPIFAALANAVDLHNFAGILLSLDYLFWFVYRIRRKNLVDHLFIPQKGLLRDSKAALKYYFHSIFIGRLLTPGPTWYKTLDPIQKAIITLIMFCFLPAEVLTGILLFDVQSMRNIIEYIGGIRVIDELHIAFAYLLTASVIIHLYINSLVKRTLQGVVE
jgi:thiosulfate reductase cytochrome b subunit